MRVGSTPRSLTRLLALMELLEVLYSGGELKGSSSNVLSISMFERCEFY